MLRKRPHLYTPQTLPGFRQAGRCHPVSLDCSKRCHADPTDLGGTMYRPRQSLCTSSWQLVNTTDNLSHRQSQYKQGFCFQMTSTWTLRTCCRGPQLTLFAWRQLDQRWFLAPHSVRKRWPPDSVQESLTLFRQLVLLSLCERQDECVQAADSAEKLFPAHRTRAKRSRQQYVRREQYTVGLHR